MTFVTVTPGEFGPVVPSRRPSRGPALHGFVAALALTSITVGGGWMLSVHQSDTILNDDDQATVQIPSLPVPHIFDAELFAPRSVLQSASAPFGQNAPLSAGLATMDIPALAANDHAPAVVQVAEAKSAQTVAIQAVTPENPGQVVAQAGNADVPLPVPMPTDLQGGEAVPFPTPRPPDLRVPGSREAPSIPSRRLAQAERAVTAPVAVTPDNRTFLQKLFNIGGGNQPNGPALAYAAPESGLLSGARTETSSSMIPSDRTTAIYDISAHTVYMPDGSTLEAHSGLGAQFDDPRYVHVKMRGPTPPHLYDLTFREKLFHGVRALRLNPVGSGGLFGRDGLLAHTYMLGQRGDSNGCVSFKNYAAFLQAFENGTVRRLAVVARRS